MTIEYKTQDEVIADRRAARIRGLRQAAQHLYVSEVNSRSGVESEQIKAMHAVILDILKDYEHENEKVNPDTLSAMLDEVVDLLNQREHMDAIKVFRQYYGIKNVWCCVKCGTNTGGYNTLRGCPKCGSKEMVIRVIRSRQA